MTFGRLPQHSTTGKYASTFVYDEFFICLHKRSVIILQFSHLKKCNLQMLVKTKKLPPSTYPNLVFALQQRA